MVGKVFWKELARFFKNGFPRIRVSILDCIDPGLVNIYAFNAV
jgi:hypothetical protein